MFLIPQPFLTLNISLSSPAQDGTIVTLLNSSPTTATPAGKLIGSISLYNPVANKNKLQDSVGPHLLKYIVLHILYLLKADIVKPNPASSVPVVAT